MKRIQFKNWGELKLFENYYIWTGYDWFTKHKCCIIKKLPEKDNNATFSRAYPDREDFSDTIIAAVGPEWDGTKDYTRHGKLLKLLYKFVE